MFRVMQQPTVVLVVVLVLAVFALSLYLSRGFYRRTPATTPQRLLLALHVAVVAQIVHYVLQYGLVWSSADVLVKVVGGIIFATLWFFFTGKLDRGGSGRSRVGRG